ncbi:hypothetical protein Tco_1309283, partial [Tanacetum coccineum]
MGGESGGGDAGGNEGFAEVGVGGPDGVDWVGQCVVVTVVERWFTAEEVAGVCEE